jgi:Gram-negative bacterial TonB protein C-terminal
MRSNHWAIRMLVIAAISAMLAASAFAGGDKEKQDDLMQTALKQSVRSTGATPFEMKLTGKVYGYTKGPMDIEYESKWSAPDEWFDQMSFSGFVERRLAQGDKLWMQRNAGYEPLRAAQLQRMMDLAALHLASDEAVKSVEHHGKGGKETQCAKIESRYDSFTLCFDEKGRLVREERTSIILYPNSDFSTAAKIHQPPVKKVYEYSEYTDFNGRSYPKKLRVLEDAKPVIEAEVTEMKGMPAIPVGKVEPPKDIEPQAWCVAPSPAYIEHLTRFLPRAGSMIGGFSTEGRLVISGVIDPDGSFANQSITLRSTRGLDDPVQLALREWKFQPAKCGDKPIPQDAFLDLNVETRPGAGFEQIAPSLR